MLHPDSTRIIQLFAGAFVTDSFAKNYYTVLHADDGL